MDKGKYWFIEEKTQNIEIRVSDMNTLILHQTNIHSSQRTAVIILPALNHH